MATMTNREFGQRVGIHHSMASRIRNGQRCPGSAVIEKISTEFGIPIQTLVKARNKGAEEFGELIRKRIFKDKPAKAA